MNRRFAVWLTVWSEQVTSGYSNVCLCRRLKEDGLLGMYFVTGCCFEVLVDFCFQHVFYVLVILMLYRVKMLRKLICLRDWVNGRRVSS